MRLENTPKIRGGGKLAALFAICCAFVVEALFAGEYSADGCSVKWTDRSLQIGNGLFSRSYIAVGDSLRTVSLKSVSGTEWQVWRHEAAETGKMSVSVASAPWSPVGVEGVRVDVSIGERTTVLHVFPGVPGVISQAPLDTSIVRVHDLDRDFDGRKEWLKVTGDACGRNECIYYGNRHVKVKSVVCVDQTDIRDHLVSIDERLPAKCDWAYSLATTVLDCRDLLTGSGVSFVRIAPMPGSRPQQTDDFVVDGEHGRIALLANGYPLAELVYEGGEDGRQRAMIAFQRALRPYRPDRDGLLLSNTWGGGNGDSRICERFLLGEIEAGARIGVDVIQIDDGWEHGRTTTSRRKALAGRKKVWNGYWAEDPDFWKPDNERFPNGLSGLVRKAAEKGMRFGLWFGPDSSNDAANWEKDAHCLLDFHRRLGIDYFKMDSMKSRTQLALNRNRMMFNKLLRDSNGKMVFDLDCTAEVRPGYFGLMDIGPLFVENRYSKHRSYWPHHTLRNLWDLSHVIDPVRLRFEFNNPDTNHEIYGDDPLSHARYRPDTLFATVMTASPLAWMELSDVSEASIAALAPLVARWKKERSRWHGGIIHPVGGRPDGVAWTGFVSEPADGDGGYVLLFREMNAESTFSIDMRKFFGQCAFRSIEVIGGRGSASFSDGRLSVAVPEKLDYIWVKMRKCEG